MAPIESEENRRRIGRITSIASIACAIITGLLVIRTTTVNPRTDDAEVFANSSALRPSSAGLS